MLVKTTLIDKEIIIKKIDCFYIMHCFKRKFYLTKKRYEELFMLLHSVIKTEAIMNFLAGFF